MKKTSHRKSKLGIRPKKHGIGYIVSRLKKEDVESQIKSARDFLKRARSEKSKKLWREEIKELKKLLAHFKKTKAERLAERKEKHREEREEKQSEKRMEVILKAKKRMARRSPRAQRADLSKKAKRVLKPVNYYNLKLWARHPNLYDMLGVDTPGAIPKFGEVERELLIETKARKRKKKGTSKRK